MKLIFVLLGCTIGLAYSATLNVNTQCNLCKTTLDWVRSNDNVLSLMKDDEQVSDELIEVLESDRATEDVCSLLSMCTTEAEADEEDYLTILRGGGHGGHGGHGHGHGGHGHNKKKPHGHVDPGSANCPDNKC